MTKRVNMTLDDDAAALLPQLAGSQRKQGELVSRLIRDAAAGVKVESGLNAYAAIGRQVVELLRGVSEVVREEHSK